MLQNYTPVSQLTPSEVDELRQRASTMLGESVSPVHLSTGKVVSANEARAFARPRTPGQPLFG